MRRLYTLPLGANILLFLRDLLSQKNLEEMAIVFPGKRPALYLKHLIATEKGHAFFPPLIFSMESFVEYLISQDGKWREIEYPEAVYFLYEALKALRDPPLFSLQISSFGEFVYIGYEMLHLIDMLDMENVEDWRLKNVQASAEIGYEVPQMVNILLSRMAELRRAFHDLLVQRGYLTRGLKYLLALRSLPYKKEFRFREICFCGIFALTRVEREIIQSFWWKDMATIIVEGGSADSPILKELIDSFDVAEETPPLLPAHRSIEIHSCPDTHAEAITVYEILKRTEPGPFGIILPEPNSLFPLLTFAVERIGRPYNVTLGYPFGRTPMFSLLSSVLKAQMTRKANGLYGTLEYASVMLHPLVKPQISDVVVSLENWILAKREPFVDLSEVENLFSSPILRGLHELFFQGMESSTCLRDLMDHVIKVLDFVVSLPHARSAPLFSQFVESAFDLMERIATLEVSKVRFHAEEQENRKLICEFLLFFAKKLTIPFDTEPLESIEIMGVLEARCLTFTNLIVLDMNERVFPRTRRIDPLVPLGVYGILGLPSPGREEEIFRYYFRRLVSSASNIHLLYVEADEKSRSRFIEELLWEEEKRNRKIGVVPINTVHRLVDPRGKEELLIEKTDKVLNLLQAKPLSATSVDEYLKCPVSFFLREVLNLKGRQLIGWEIEERQRGELVHLILKDTFQGLIGLEIDERVANILHKNLRASIERHLGKKTGDFYLFRRIVERRLESYLRMEVARSREPFCVHALELTCEEDMTFNGKTIRLKGKIDRVDYLLTKKEYLIIDYKTGQADTVKKKTDLALHTVKEVREQIASFQLPLYVYLFHKKTGVGLERINAKFLLLKNGTEKGLYEGLGEKDRVALFRRYMHALSLVIQHMFDPAEPMRRFDEKSCERCDFRDLCGP